MSDKIRFCCLTCGRKLSVPGAGAGKRVRCPDCGTVQQAPRESMPKLTPPELPPEVTTPELTTPLEPEGEHDFASREIEESGEYRYEAFISYRHVEPDRQWARWLHTALETYRVPHRLVKERGVSPRLKRVFRDEEELPASADLNKEIETALREARFLIVVCSPRTPASEWVNKEVVRFREMGRHDRILALLVEGEPAESFPRALREIRRTIADGQGLSREVIEDTEPLAADVRMMRSESGRQLKQMAKLRVLACILGVRFDDLRQRERERRHRRIALAGSLAIALLLVMIGVITFSYMRVVVAAAETAKQRKIAEETVREMASRLMAKYVDNGLASYDTGDFAGALLWHVEALKMARAAAPNPTVRTSAEIDQRMRIRQIISQLSVPLACLVHGAEINYAEFSPDGTRVATASVDRTARIWDATTGQPVGSAMHHAERVFRASFSNDSRWVVTAAMDNCARVWDAQTGEPVTEQLMCDGGVSDARFSPDNTRVVTSSGTIHIFNAHSGKPEPTNIRQAWPISSVCFSPDGSHILSAGGQDAALWDASTGELTGQRMGHHAKVIQAVFSADGKMIVTARADNTARLWEGFTGKALTEPLQHDKAVTSACFNRDGTRVLTGSLDGTARMWEVPSGKPLAILRHPGPVKCVAFSPDGQRMLTGCADGVARLWNSATGALVWNGFGHGLPINSVCFSPDGTRILTASRDGTARIWDASVKVPEPHIATCPGVPMFADFSEDGRRVLLQEGTSVLVWDVTTETPSTPAMVHDRPISHAAFSRDGTRILTVCGDSFPPLPAWEPPGSMNRVRTLPTDDNFMQTIFTDPVTVAVWDARTGRRISHLPDIAGGNHAAISENGRRVLVCRGESFQSYDATTLQPDSPSLPHHHIRSACFSPDGRLMASAGQDKAARLWDAQSGKQLGSNMTHYDDIYFATFSPDGQRIATGSRDTTARIWDGATGEPRTPPLPHEWRVLSAVFSPDGSRLATLCLGTSVRIWDCRTGSAMTPVLQHDAQVFFVTFSPDGMAIVTGGNDQTVRLWDATSGKPLMPPLKHKSPVIRAVLTQDKKRLVTACADKTIWTWDIAPEDRPIEQLTALAQLLSSRKLDISSGLLPLNEDELRNMWVALDGFAAVPSPAGTGTVEKPERLTTLMSDQEFVQRIQKYNGLISAVPTDEKPYIEEFKPTDKPAWAVVDTPGGFKSTLRKEGGQNVLEVEMPVEKGGYLYVGKEVSGPFAIEVEARAESPQPCDMSIFLGKVGNGPGFQFGGMFNTVNRLWTERRVGPGQTDRPGLFKELPANPLIKTGQWYTIRMEVHDGMVKGAIDGKVLGEMRLAANYDWAAKRKPLIYCCQSNILLRKVSIYQFRVRTDEEKAKALGQVFDKMTREQVNQKIDDLVKLLGSDTLATREAAQQLLGMMGETAQPALKKAMVMSSDEVKSRAAKLLASEGQPPPSLP